MEIVMEVSSDFYYLTLNTLLSEFECKHFISIAPFMFTTALWDVSILLSLFYRWRNRITDAATNQW